MLRRKCRTYPLLLHACARTIAEKHWAGTGSNGGRFSLALGPVGRLPRLLFRAGQVPLVPVARHADGGVGAAGGAVVLTDAATHAAGGIHVGEPLERFGIAPVGRVRDGGAVFVQPVDGAVGAHLVADETLFARFPDDARRAVDDGAPDEQVLLFGDGEGFDGVRGAHLAAQVAVLAAFPHPGRQHGSPDRAQAPFDDRRLQAVGRAYLHAGAAADAALGEELLGDRPGGADEAFAGDAAFAVARGAPGQGRSRAQSPGGAHADAGEEAPPVEVELGARFRSPGGHADRLLRAQFGAGLALDAFGRGGALPLFPDRVHLAFEPAEGAFVARASDPAAEEGDAGDEAQQRPQRAEAAAPEPAGEEPAGKDGPQQERRGEPASVRRLLVGKDPPRLEPARSRKPLDRPLQGGEEPERQAPEGEGDRVKQPDQLGSQQGARGHRPEHVILQPGPGTLQLGAALPLRAHGAVRAVDQGPERTDPTAEGPAEEKG